MYKKYYFIVYGLHQIILLYLPIKFYKGFCARYSTSLHLNSGIRIINPHSHSHNALISATPILLISVGLWPLVVRLPLPTVPAPALPAPLSHALWLAARQRVRYRGQPTYAG